MLEMTATVAKYRLAACEINANVKKFAFYIFPLLCELIERGYWSSMISDSGCVDSALNAERENIFKTPI